MLLRRPLGSSFPLVPTGDLNADHARTQDAETRDRARSGPPFRANLLRQRQRQPVALNSSSSLVEESDYLVRIGLPCPRRERREVGDRTVVSGYAWAMRSSPCFRRAAIESGIALVSSSCGTRLGAAAAQIGVAQHRERDPEWDGEIGGVPGEAYRIRLWLDPATDDRIEHDHAERSNESLRSLPRPGTVRG